MDRDRIEREIKVLVRCLRVPDLMTRAPRLSATNIRCHRTGSGRAVALLHCLGVDHRIWDETVAALASEHELIRYDLPGHGETPVPTAGYSIADLSAQLGDVLEREGVRRAAVVGISLGGLVAQHFAASFPERVGRLVLVDTTPRYSDAMQAMWVERAATARTKGVSVMTDALLSIWFTSDFVAKDAPAVRYVRDGFSRMAGEGYALACEALGAAGLRPLAGNIKAPTLVVCGTEDIPEFLDAARWLAETIPDARLQWLEPARHASLLEQPAAFVRLLRGFLQ